MAQRDDSVSPAGPDREILLEVAIEPNWHGVRSIRKNVSDALRQFPREFRTSATIAATELVENAVKHGERLPDVPVRFLMFLQDGNLSVQTHSHCRSQNDVAALQKAIEELNSSTDKSTLYMVRLEELLAHSSETGKLGLLRITFEAGFGLSCRYDNRVVSLTATRELP